MVAKHCLRGKYLCKFRDFMEKAGLVASVIDFFQ